MEAELQKLGAIIRKARLDKNMSQKMLAYDIGKDQPSLARVESGNINPTYLYLLKVAKGLKMSLVELLSVDPDN